jgi:hypothetical protein
MIHVSLVISLTFMNELDICPSEISQEYLQILDVILRGHSM